jgi:hypothetical protein
MECGLDRRTLPVFEFPLHDRVVDVGQDDELVQVFPHAPQPMFLGCWTSTDTWVLVHQVLYTQLLDLNFLDLVLPVFQQDFPGLLETLVRQLFEGNLVGLAEGRSTKDGAATTGSNGLDMFSPQQSAFLLLVLHHLRV